MNIFIQTVPHEYQRYDTVGDWFRGGDVVLQHEPEDLIVRVSKMSDPRYEFLVALHELIEAKLCEHRKIRQEDVDTFDQLFEHERGVGKQTPYAEPGDDERAPYHREHQIATLIERQVAYWLDVSWEDYENEVLAL